MQSEKILFHLKRLIPKGIFRKLRPIYHYKMALLSAIIYRFPSRKIKVVAVTGTKGKSSVTEIISAILEEAGYKTAVSNTIHFKVGDKSEDNLYKMSMPGRFFIQQFLRRAVNEKCDYAIVETTSQGAQFFRHRFIDFDAFILTNIAPEHIEAHGSYDNYVSAKLEIAKQFAKSKKETKVMVVNGDIKEKNMFLDLPADEKLTYTLRDAGVCEAKEKGIMFTWQGVRIESPLSGTFNIENCLAACTYANSEGIRPDIIASALKKFALIKGRVERIEEGQDFTVIVDYAHTPDSLQKLYDHFKNTKCICVLGNTGGGRDVWKRDEMAHIAERECDEIILTNEDPYDDDPKKIVEDMAKAISKKKPHIIMDRREAIRTAISLATTLRQAQGDKDVSVLITGKGTDPYIMGPKGTKIPWSDAQVSREELKKVLAKQN